MSKAPLCPHPVQSFDNLVTSRKIWIDEILQPWCRQASRSDLLKAADEWQNLAGRVDPDLTLWLWAWSRFPVLVHDNLHGLDETFRVKVTLHSGEMVVGFPNSRASRAGMLTLLGDDGSDLGPFDIDSVAAVHRIDADVGCSVDQGASGR